MMTQNEPTIRSGVCYAFFAHDISLSIDLDEAERLISVNTQRETIRHKRRAPQSFQYHPAPLRITQATTPLDIGGYRTAATVDAVLYDFGAVSIAYGIPIWGPLRDLLALSEALYDNADLLADARQRVEDLSKAIRPALAQPGLVEFVEDYLIFQIEELAPPADVHNVIIGQRQLLAQILRSERAQLSDQEVADALASPLSYGPGDVALIDWYATLLFDRDADDVRTVLEFANVELLEMRFLDRQLDRALDESYRTLARRPWRRRGTLGAHSRELRRIAQHQADAAVLFEGVNNALKLLGDQFLARVYRTASQRLHLPEWDAAILRKLQTLESIYDKLSDESTSRRMEVLEWIIIVLIAVSIALPFIAPGGH